MALRHRLAQAFRELLQLLLRQPQRIEQAAELAQGGRGQGGALDQVEDIEPRLQVGDLARQEGIGGVRAGIRLGRRAFGPGREEGGQPRLFQRNGPGFREVVRTVTAAREQVFAQDQPRPVERADQQPCRLHACPFGGFHLDGAPLLPHRRSRESGHQRHGEHRREERRPALAHGARPAAAAPRHDLPPPLVGVTQSRVIVPASARPGGSTICRRTPSGMLVGAVGPMVCGVGAVALLDRPLYQAPSR